MALQIPSIPPLNPHSDQNSISQRWTKWKNNFQYFILVSGVNDDARHYYHYHQFILS